MPILAAQEQLHKKQTIIDNLISPDAYIVKYKDSEAGKRNLNNRNKRLEKSFKHLPAHFKVNLSKAEVEELRKDSNVLYIEKDSIVTKVGDTTTSYLNQIHIPEVHHEEIYGDGVKVAVFDTGINTQTSELHINGGISFVPNDTTLSDPNGHGTFVAGILAATQDDQGLIGVAPHVELYSVKVLNANGNGTYSQVIDGIEWAIDNHMDIVSMSFAGNDHSIALEEVMQLAYNSGILLVAATGNDGIDEVSYPAKFSSVIAVGAVDGNNLLASFSNTGEEVELVAPGVNIEGLPSTGNQHITMSGTSVAVPQVAGVAALIKGKYPQYTNQEVRNVLDASATVIGDSYKFGHGIINAATAFGMVSQAYEGIADQQLITQPKDLTVRHVPASFSGAQNSTSVSDSVYEVNAADISYPTSYDQGALNNVNLKADEAPFSIGSNNESISTLSGGLSLQNTDLTLPGRNGLSFSLNRQYDSSSSQYYDMDVQQQWVYHYRVYSHMNLEIERKDRYGNLINPYQTDRMNQVNVGFYPGTPIGDPIPYKHYVEGSFWLSYSSGYYFCGNGTITAAEFGNCYDAIFSTYRSLAGSMDYVGPYYYSGTNDYRLRAYYASPTSYSPQPLSVNLYQGYFNKTSGKTYDESMFPIGKGWSWNISSIELKRGKRYLHLAGKGTYEINGSNQLVGYPWKDLTLSGDYSSYVLTSLNGVKQVFNYDGKLVRITDTYGNNIEFTYSYVNPYGTVLTGITDAIGNTINIAYSAANVVLTSGDKTVTYTKQYRAGTEFLTTVQDTMGRVTSYNYADYNASFSFALDTSSNIPGQNPFGLLTKVSHPTGAITNYAYESSPIRRYYGSRGYNEAYRISQRQERTPDQQIYNQKSFSYSGDMASSYSGGYTFSTTVNDGLKHTTYTNFKQFISDTIPAAYYTTGITETAGSQQQTEIRSYDQTRHLPVPSSTSITFSNGSSTSTAVTTSQTYDDYGNVLTSTDPAGIQTTYNYDGGTHLLSSVSQQLNNTLTRFTQYMRNAQKSLTQIVIRDNNVNGTIKAQTDISYDGYGNPITITVKDDNRNIILNKEYGTQYSGAFLTKQSGNVTDANNIDSTIVENMIYDKSSGRLTEYIDGKGYSSSYQYDKLGRATRATFPDGSYLSINYDDVSNKVTAIDSTGLTSVTQWNSLGWKTSNGITGSGFMTYDYDTYGRMSWSKDARNNTTSYGYDAWRRPIQTLHPDGSTATILYDDVNRSKKSTDEEMNVYQERYDVFGRITNKDWLKATGTVSLGVLSYDYTGNLLTSTDANANTTTYTYDVLNRLISVKDAENQTTQYGYSLANKLISTRYADGNTLEKKYDQRGRLIQTIDPSKDPSSSREIYFYDANNNLSVRSDSNGQVQTFNYNNRNRLTLSITHSAMVMDPDTIGYSYDAAGRRLSMQDSTGTTSYGYDAITKRLTNLTYPDGKTVTYHYDNQGNRETMTDPFGYETVYHYDSRNRLTNVGPSINNWDVTYNYKRNNLLSTMSLANGTNSTYSYDGANLTGLIQKMAGGAIINASAYEYDNNNNQTRKSEEGSVYSFGYDNLNRIITSSQFNETYTYDTRGNRQTLTGEQLFDRVGTSYVYDGHNRMTQVLKAPGSNWSNVRYRYNGDGLLYERIENGHTTRYYNDGAEIIAEGEVINSVASLKARYVRGSGLIARVDGSGYKAYYMENGHRDIVGLVDGSGNWLSQYSYDIWGKPLATPKEGIQQPFRYSGEFWDSSANLQYLRARWYDPSMGRFINQDTYEGDITNPLSLNLYTYVHNNPLRYNDPTGHYCISSSGDNAHMDGCSNSDSTFVDNKYATGQPLIENGSLYGYVGQTGPSSPVQMTYGQWRSGQPTLYSNNQSDQYAWMEQAFGFTADIAAAFMTDGFSLEFTTAAKSMTAVANGANNIATMGKLVNQLTFQEAESVFLRSGRLNPEVVRNSEAIISGSELGNPYIINALTADGSSINNWAKMSTPTYRSPSGDFQVHYYQNQVTGTVSDIEMKIKFNSGSIGK